MKRYLNLSPSPSCIYSLLLIFFISCNPPSMATTSTTKTPQNKSIYLVLLEGEPVAFHIATPHDSQIKSQQKFNPESESAFTYKKSLIESHDHLLKSTLDSGSYTKLYSFHHIINGFAVHTTQSQVDKLRRAQGVSLIEKDRGVKLMTTYTPYFLGLPRGAWTQEGGEEHAGEGIVIGVIDTGINPRHPSFAYDPSKPYDDHPQFSGACDVGPNFPQGSCNGKIVSARFFSAGAASALPLNASTDLTPFDQVGHGSHVASIAAGNWGVPVVVNGAFYGLASGMAPRARIAVYKAIYPAGGTMADVVYAIEQATKDGVDVMGLSIGPDEPGTEEEETLTMMSVLEILLLFVRRSGVFVVQAAGNKGPAQATVVSFSPWAFAAASSTTGRIYTSTLVLGNGSLLFGMGLSGPTQGKGNKKLKLVHAIDATKVVKVAKNETTIDINNAEECQDPETLDPMVVKNSIVICTFSQGFINGTSTITAILNTSTLLSFAGFIFAANPNYGDFIAQPLPFSLPAIMIPSIADAKTLMEYYNSHTERDKSRGKVKNYKARASIKEGRVASFNEAAPTVSSFSSRGPDILDNIKLNPADVLKPDILAPGHQIWAAWSPSSSLSDPLFSGENFALLSGTSMAAPHVAGVAALLMKAHPTWSPSMVASAICTSSLQCNNKGLPIMAHGLDQAHALYPSSPFDHGAGFINPTAALDPGLVFSSAFEDYVNFLCTLPGLDPSKVRSVTGKACNTSHQTSTSDLNLPSITLSKLSKFKSVKRQVLNVAKYPEKYLCSIVAPQGTQVDVMPRWFTIFPQEIQVLEIQINVTNPLELFAFGEIVLVGSLNHVVRFPLSVFPMEV